MTNWGDVFSKLTYWYGLQYSELKNMPVRMLRTYMERLEARMSEQKMMLADVENMPHMKKNDRKKTIERWMRGAEMNTQPAKPASPARLKMMGIGVRHV